MKQLSWSWTLVAVLVTGCGKYKIGDGADGGSTPEDDASLTGGAAGKAGRGGANGGSMDAGGSMQGAGGSMQGAGGSMQGAGGADACETSADCPQIGAPCEMCPDGSSVCPTVECVNGECVGSFPTCVGQMCGEDSDCPVGGAPCQMCENGSSACPWSRCDNGYCSNGMESCMDDPACMTDDDCPGVGLCSPCPNNNNECAELRCTNGACVFQCDDPGGMCSGQGESCASGETCCDGLTCCAGVPVPMGQEYCGRMCPISDRNLKRDVAHVDANDVLESVARLPISTWSYKTEEKGIRHMGPMAQDFHAAFGLGASDRTILQVDGDGVALAAIQGLHRRLERLEAENRKLRNEVDALRRRRR